MPVNARNTVAASDADVVMRPMVSNVRQSGATPSVGHSPFVVLRPNMPLYAGILTEPPVSDPIREGAETR